MRRFESMVRFEMLNEEMQLEFWKNNLPAGLKLATNCDLSLMIKKHPLSPAAIVNTIIRSSVLTYKDKSDTIYCPAGWKISIKSLYYGNYDQGYGGRIQGEITFRLTDQVFIP